MKHNIAITRMQIVYRWETGDVHRIYSPKERKCTNTFRKRIGGFLVSFGASVLFGKTGWKTYINMVEGQNDAD